LRDDPAGASRFTVFSFDRAGDIEEQVLDVINEVDLHHGSSGGQPALRRLDVYGTALTEPVSAMLEKFGLSSTEATAGGFSAAQAGEQERTDIVGLSDKEPMKLAELDEINLTASQAFLALGQYLLDRSAEMGGEGALPTLTADVRIEGDGMSADPAAISDWAGCVQKILEGDGS
jgi:hypothetical protein